MIEDSPARALSDLARERDARAIVVGTRGESPLRGFAARVDAAQAAADRGPSGARRPRASALTVFDLIAELPVEVDGYRLEELRAPMASGRDRVCTLIRIGGGGHEGAGEDVVYDAGGAARVPAGRRRARSVRALDPG